MGSSETPAETRAVFFFDIDNCLYPRSLRIHNLMADLIDKYFVTHLALSAEAAKELRSRYYRDYGLAISGLVKHHQVDPLAYNKEVDDALPLEGLIKRDEGLRTLLAGMDRTKVKLWLFTNAHITHARRVVRLLELEEFFEGITYCNYAKEPLIAKPHAEMFDKAEAEAGLVFAKAEAGEIQRHEKCFFVDDSALNCKAARDRGWNVVHKLEPEDAAPKKMSAQYQIRQLEELQTLFPQFWKGNGHANRAMTGGQAAGYVNGAPS